MNVAYFDLVGGAAGNMLLGALIDAGAPALEIERQLRSLRLPKWEMVCRRVDKAGVSAIHADFVIDGEDDDRWSGPGHGHEHGTTPAQVAEIIESSELEKPVRERCMQVYGALARAESAAHGVNEKEIHFHEVGAADAILDVAACCLALRMLDVDEVRCSEIPMGRGLINMLHGAYPNPGPATANLLKGFVIRDAGEYGELVTPTAAALLSVLVREPQRTLNAMVLEQIGYGAGSRDYSIPNVTRVFLGKERHAPQETIVIAEANIDDMSPQHYELAFERLFEAGALDVWMTPVIMKKQRPGVVLSALCERAALPLVTRAFLTETSTIGVRTHEVARATLQREVERVETPFGTVRLKHIGDGRTTIEYDDAVRIARERGEPLAKILDGIRSSMVKR